MRRPVVMMSFTLDGAGQMNPYVRQLVSGLTSAADVEGFSWRRLLIGRIDVLHVHWPEQLMRGSSCLVRAVKAALLSAFLISHRWRGIRIVRTVHNSTPHEPADAMERWMSRWLDRSTSERIYLHDGVETSSRDRVILHGHYRDYYDQFRSDPATVRGRLLFFGLIRSYKGVDQLLSAFETARQGHALEGISLRLAGHGVDPALVSRIEAAVEARSDVSAQIELLSDAALVKEIEQSEVVVLPYLRMENSGALLAALSLARPVVVPDSPMTRQVEDEVGPGWVFRYRPPLTAASLTTVVDAAREQRPRQSPNLSAREWPDALAAHWEAYGFGPEFKLAESMRNSDQTTSGSVGGRN